MQIVSSSSSIWICTQLFAVMGGCLGCCTKPPLIIDVNDPAKGHKAQGQGVRQHNVTEDFWSSSTYEMDNSAAQSQRSVSSISMSNPTDAHSSFGVNPPEFVNRGLLLWNQTRQQWIANKGSDHPKKDREPSISWNATYENLLGSNKPFPHSIPLSEMVNFLVDVWEQEGLYD